MPPPAHNRHRAQVATTRTPIGEPSGALRPRGTPPSGSSRILILVLALAILLVTPVLFAVRLPGPERRRLPVAVSLLPLLLGLGVLALSCITTVGTKDVGVVTTFGKPTGRDLENGLHVKLPWQKVTELDGAINPDSYTEASHCINVRIGDSTTACVEGTIRWRIVPEQASVLYQDYRSDDVNATVKESLVKTQFNAALNDVLGTFNPLESVAAAAQKSSKSGAALTVANTAPNLDRFSAQVTESMRQHLVAASRNGQEQGRVVSITLNFIHLASTTQDKINDFLKEVGATRVAQQREQTTAAQAQANRNLSTSVSKDPNVLVSRCFDTVEEAVKANYSLPAGFSCWGSTSTVVVPSSK
jgi:regulator of protease activity HflC (stomatin/prohibitin superfamily)